MLKMSNEESERYHRQLIFPGFGKRAQNKLKNAHALIVGLGGLGGPVAIYLTSAGVGKITIIDPDTVESSNLNRQILHWESDLGKPKVVSAARKLKEANSLIGLDFNQAELNYENVHSFLNGVHVAIDCLDNKATRLILNEACYEKGVPLIHGGVTGFRGQVTTIMPGQGACLECIFDNVKENEPPFPIIGATAGLIGSIQALEAIKLLTRIGEPLSCKLLFVDMEKCEIKKTSFHGRKGCRVCHQK